MMQSQRNFTTKRFLLAGFFIFLHLGCGVKTIREPIVEQNGIEVFLRGQEKAGEPVSRGFEHPIVISDIRLAHILSRIEIRRDEKIKQNEPALSLEVLYDIAEGMSKAFEKAGPHQEVVVLATERKLSLGIFSHYYLTSFLGFMQDDQLHLHFGRIDWEIPRNKRGNDIDEPYAHKTVMKFRVMPGDALTKIGPQSIAADWRNPIFRKPNHLRVSSSGKIQRRSVLMESEESEEDAPEIIDLPTISELPPAALRELANLEEARIAGDITESQYRKRKRELLLRAAEQKQ